MKQHLSLLSDDMGLQDFLLGPRRPRRNRLLYAIHNEEWKVSQQEAAERLHEIDRANLERDVAVVDNGMTTLSTRIHSG